MKKLLLFPVLACVMLLQGCPKKDAKTAAAIALADSTAGLIAWSDAVQVLVDLKEIESAGARGQFEVNDKLRQALAQIREKIEKGFSSKDVLLQVEEVLEELRKAEASGLLGLKNPDAQIKFREITAFAQLSVRTVNNILKQLEPPPPPDPVEVEAKLRTSSDTKASGLEKWTRFVIIGQDFAFAVIRHHRLDAPAAFAAESELNSRLATLNKSRIESLP